MARTMPYDLSTIGRIAGYALLVYCAAEVVFTWHSFVLLNFFTTVEIGALTAAELDAEGAWDR